MRVQGACRANAADEVVATVGRNDHKGRTIIVGEVENSIRRLVTVIPGRGTDPQLRNRVHSG